MVWMCVQPSPRVAARDGDPTTYVPAKLLKVGQHPSPVAFHLGELGQFDKAMTKQQRRDFVKAIHSAAHGSFVGAAVYLRRVFEELIREVRDEVIARDHQGQAWPEFESARMPEKLRLLQDDLPQYVQRIRPLYAVLSDGVHNLTEEECGANYPALREAIEIILEERLAAKEKAKREQRIQAAVARMHSQHGKP